MAEWQDAQYVHTVAFGQWNIGEEGAALARDPRQTSLILIVQAKLELATTNPQVSEGRL